MSKRKTRAGAPNLPQETLERARRQAAIDRGELPTEPEPIAEPTPAPRASATPKADSIANPYRTVAASQRRAVATARSTDRRTRGNQIAGARNRPTELDAETISELLDNPTVFVSEEQLKAEYGFVVGDLRNMFGLAAGLMILLVVLATVLPH
jgi:hypothetical protein